jgi:hypothetical protein
MSNENWHCKKCNILIDGHNQYCHDGMCDDCFNQEYFPEDQTAYEQRIIKIGDKVIDPVGLTEEELEAELNFKEYIETKEGKENKLYIDAFFSFLEKTGFPRLTTYRLYDSEITETFRQPFDEVKKNLYLLCQGQGDFCDDDIYIAYAFTDEKSFFVIPLTGIIFFSGTSEASKIMQDVLNELGINFFFEELPMENLGRKLFK